MTASNQFRADVAEALIGWRLGTIPPRPDGAMAAIFHECLYDLIRLRLHIAYAPLFQGLERIERRIGVLAGLRADPWAPRGYR
jgi:hypothetical protein